MLSPFENEKFLCKSILCIFLPKLNLEQLNELTVYELDLLKETVDTLIAHVEHLKEKQSKKRT